MILIAMMPPTAEICLIVLLMKPSIFPIPNTAYLANSAVICLII